MWPSNTILPPKRPETGNFYIIEKWCGQTWSPQRYMYTARFFEMFSFGLDWTRVNEWFASYICVINNNNSVSYKYHLPSDHKTINMHGRTLEANLSYFSHRILNLVTLVLRWAQSEIGEGDGEVWRVFVVFCLTLWTILENAQ